MTARITQSAATSSVTQDRVKPAKIALFPVAVAICVVLLILFQRFVVAKVGFGFQYIDANRISTGLLFNEVDNMFYSAFMQRASNPDVFLLDNVQVNEPHKPIYFNPYYFLVGRLSHLFHVQPLQVLYVFGLLASALIVFCAYYSAIYAGFSARAARLATILVAFSSGLSIPFMLLWRLGIVGDSWSAGADYLYQDAITFSSMYAYPYHIFAQSLAALTILVVVFLETRSGNNISTYKTGFLALLILAFLNTSVHLYESILLYASYGLYCILALMRSFKVSENKQRFVILGCLTLGIVPVLLYTLWLSTQPGFSIFADAAANVARPRQFWIIGFGLTLIAALIGSIITFRERLKGPIYWFTVWILALVTLVIIISVKQTKLVSGGYFVMALLAAFGWDRLGSSLFTIRSTVIRYTALTAFLLLSSLFFITPISLYFQVYPNEQITYSADLERVQEHVLGQSRIDRPLILSDPDTSIQLIGLAPVHVWLGDRYFQNAAGTAYHKQYETILEAGLIAESDVVPGVDTLRLLLQQVKPDYLLLRVTAPAGNIIDRFEEIQLMECYTQYCLYRLYATNR